MPIPRTAEQRQLIDAAADAIRAWNAINDRKDRSTAGLDASVTAQYAAEAAVAAVIEADLPYTEIVDALVPQAMRFASTTVIGLIRDPEDHAEALGHEHQIRTNGAGTMWQMMADHARRVVDADKFGDKSKYAGLFGISRPTLDSWLR